MHKKNYPGMKRTTVWLVVCALIFFVQCSDRKPFNRNEVKAEIESLLKIQEDAYGVHTEAARKAVRGTCMDSLVYIGGDNGGMVASADFYVHDLADGYIERPHDRHFQIYNDMAIVTSVHQGYKLFGNDTLFLNSRSTKIFKPFEGTWKMAYVTYASLPVMYFATHGVAEKILKQYEGEYKLDASATETIFVRDGKLISKTGNDEIELVPLNDSTFMIPGYFGKSVFSNRTVDSGYYFEWVDGQRISFARIR